MPTTAELKSRQLLNPRQTSNAVALGQESFEPVAASHETWVTATGGTDGKTLADWMALLNTGGGSRSDLVDLIAGGFVPDIGAIAHAGEVTYQYDGTTTAITDLPGWKPFGKITNRHFGAGYGTSNAINDTVAVQAAVDYTDGLGATLWFEGLTFIHSAVTINGAPHMRMDSRDLSRTYIIQVTGGFSMFESVTTGDVTTWEIVGVRAICQPPSTDDATCFMRFSGGVAGTLLQRGTIRGNQFSNCRTAFIFDKPSRTVAAGEAGAVNWMIFEANHFLSMYRAYWFKQGLGTGNTFLADKPQINTGGAYCQMDAAVPNTVLGDVLFQNVNAGGAGAFLRIATGMAYGGQVALIGNQWDAGMDRVVEAPTDLDWTNWVVIGNNWGGGTTFGTDIAPLTRSVVTDRDMSNWQAGKGILTNATGAQNHDFFKITFTAINSPHQSIHVEFIVHGVPVSGVADSGTRMTFGVRNIAGTVTSETLVTENWPAASTYPVLSVVTGASTATLRAAITPTGAGTSLYGTVKVSGSGGFKVERL